MTKRTFYETERWSKGRTRELDSPPLVSMNSGSSYLTIMGFRFLNQKCRDNVDLPGCCQNSLIKMYGRHLLLRPQLHKIEEIKDFPHTARLKDAKSVKIKKNKDNVKFNVRCSWYPYTVFISDKEVEAVLPLGLAVKELKWAWQADLYWNVKH